MRSPRQSANETIARGRKASLVIGACIAVFVGVTASVCAIQAFETATEQTDATKNSRSPAQHPIVIRKPAGPPRVATGVVDSDGNEITASCSTCHATRRPNTANKTPADLNEFHQGLKISHGNISCLSCHDSTNYDALKLADGSRVEFSDVMTLCAQCHGPQMKDYQHGAHGGMNGYWDLSRGPQQKNNCVDCHHPHAPQFPKMRPTFKPKDRFLKPQGEEH